MASKFGGEQASKNQWVMHQNMARHKSILGYVHKPRQPKPKAAPTVTPADASIERLKTPAA